MYVLNLVEYLLKRSVYLIRLNGKGLTAILVLNRFQPEYAQ